MSPTPPPVLVAMSGGVDSTVTAALLKERGHEVRGVTLALGGGGSCGEGAARAAARAADHLGIPHEVLPETAGPFEDEVLRPAWDAYASGLTPNPCVRCNRRVKFRSLASHADRLGIQLLATGHYARVEPGVAGQGPALLRGLDPGKDQSYFLSRLGLPLLARLVLPLGGMHKAEVRRVAAGLGLPNAQRPESQDACLPLEGDSFSETLRNRFNAPARPGEVVDTRGKVLGHHQGLHRFTIGQRKGLGVPLGQRAYVVELDARQDRVVLSHEPGDLLSVGLVAEDARWLVPIPPEEDGGAAIPGETLAQIRYRHRAAPARIVAQADGRVSVTFEAPQRAVTPGQTVVFYRGDRVLGAGWIASGIRHEGEPTEASP